MNEPMIVHNPARDRLIRGEVALGAGLRLARTVEIAKIFRTCGYDWLFIDLEHGAMTLDTAVQISAAALDAAIAPFVRVPRGELWMATQALDGGALGIIVPHVDSADEAREIVRGLRYAPVGHRSITGNLAVLDYRPVKAGEAARAINEAVLIVAMLESPLGIENAEHIAAVDGIDVLLIGTNDLCMELGIPGEIDHPKVVEAYGHMIDAARRYGKWPGMGGVYDERLMGQFITMGARLVLAGMDIAFLMSAAARRADLVRRGSFLQST